jgi:hypothetical protein
MQRPILVMRGLTCKQVRMMFGRIWPRGACLGRKQNAVEEFQ